MFSRERRIIGAEWLDTAEPAAADASLRDLTRINRWLGGHRIIRKIFANLVQRSEPFSVLDVGAASGDASSVLAGAFPRCTVVSLDRDPLHLRRAPAPRVAADAFRLPFPQAGFDFVFCSLFLHHFEDAVVVELIGAFRRIARRAVVVIDLERHPVAHDFIPATRKLFRWHEITVNDAAASVQAAFTAEDFQALARAAGGSSVVVRKHRPWYRLSAVIRA